VSSSPSARRRIAVLTGTRADYGLLYWLIADLAARPNVELQLLVTGTHLAPEFGHTVDAIEADGFPIAARADLVISGDTPAAVTTSMGLGLIKFGDIFERLCPDVLVVLGDRYEALAAATAALISRIPIAHIHGGELSEGAIDDAMRHAITKMASLHFAATEPYRARIAQLGEDPERVFTVGAMACENIDRSTLLTRAQLEADLGFALGRPLFLVTYHPVTLQDESPAEPFRNLLAALDNFPAASIVMTMSNADAGGRTINQLIDAYAAAHPGRVHALASLGRLRYLSLLTEADVVIGNSSSGIIEAPLVGTPTVNLGDRQRGRLRVASIVDCAERTSEVAGAIRTGLTLDRGGIAAAGRALYGTGGGVRRIVEVLEQANLSALRLKTFYTFR